MQKQFVLTLTGPDRIGFVEEVTGLLLERGGNVETSRMARLGGEFAILMLVSMPAELFSSLDSDLDGLAARGYKVTTTPVDRTYAQAHPGWLPYRLEVQGADHEGIIHEIAHYLSGHGINIEIRGFRVDAGTHQRRPSVRHDGPGRCATYSVR